MTLIIHSLVLLIKIEVMNRITFLLVIIISTYEMVKAQQLDFFVRDINASGGVTMGPDGNLYVSDFGSKLGASDTTTHVYKIDLKTKEVSVFASGFKGASGATFDNKGNFYQSNPFGHSISKVSKDGKVNHSFVTQGLKTPIGLATDTKDNLYVCNCSGNSIGKIDANGNYSEFATSDLFKCPNGLTKDKAGNLYACNFSDGKVLKIDQLGNVSLFSDLPYSTAGKPVGNGHLTYFNGKIYVTTIGKGEVYKVDENGAFTKVIGKPFAFVNVEGDVDEASLCKPNGIAISPDGKSLYINVSDAPWNTRTLDLYPAHVMVITDFE